MPARRQRVLASILLGALTAPATAQDLDHPPAPRMGAFQCLVCTEGGALTGVLPDHGRARSEFGAFQELCVSDYRYIDGQLYLRFKLEGQLWPDHGAFTVQASSWEATCRKPPQ